MSDMALYKRSAQSASAALRRLADEDLMQLVAESNATAFAVLYERHTNVAFSLAFRMCGKRAIAEEVVQDAFLSLWRGGSRYDRTRGSVRTWVLGIVHNRAIDALRRGIVHDRGRVSDEGIEERLEAPERTDQEVGRRDEAREIKAALEGLPVEQSHVIELAYYGGFTHSEIATMLDTPIGTVKGRMRLGLQKLRMQLSQPEVTG
jgi:RNA polymerase sigma-70 factor, ECF subfamily